LGLLSRIAARKRVRKRNRKQQIRIKLKNAITTKFISIGT
jgi:hypothetical protein